MRQGILGATTPESPTATGVVMNKPKKGSQTMTLSLNPEPKAEFKKLEVAQATMDIAPADPIEGILPTA
jgi:hypothetical protein